MSGVITSTSRGVSERVVLEPVEQMVVEHLHLAQRAVTRMHPQGRVRRADRKFGAVVASPVPQVEDVGLDVLQQVRLRRVGERAVFVPIRRLQHQVQEVAAQRAHRGQQPVARFEMELGSAAASPCCMRLENPLGLARVDDQAPVFFGRLEQEQVKINASAQRAEDLQIGRRQGRDAEDGDALGHRLRLEIGPGRLLAELLEQGGQVRPRLLLVQPPPQRRLPKLVRVIRAALTTLVPRQHQLGPEHEILVKQVGNLRGELEALPGVGLVRQVVLERAEFRLGQHLGQQPHDLPKHHLAVERGRLRRERRLPVGLERPWPEPGSPDFRAR